MKRLLFFALATFMIANTYAQEKHYGIESAIIKGKSTVMGQEILTTQYFTDYGAKESADASITMQGHQFETFSMMKDGYTYVANLTLKQGTKIKLSDVLDDYKNVNYLNLTDDVKKRYNIKENGTETFFGKECKKYDMEYEVMGQNFKCSVSVWKGIVLKSEMTVQGQTFNNEVIEISENVEIPKEKFELPEGINYMELNPKIQPFKR